MKTPRQPQPAQPNDGLARAVAEAAANVASAADLVARAAAISRMTDLDRAAAVVELADVKARLGALFDRMRRRRKRRRGGL